MYTLYGGGYSRGVMIEMVMAELDLPFKTITIDTKKKEHQSPQYLKINPAGWVPALMTPQGETLTETPAINLYLAERHGGGALAPTTEDPDRPGFLCRLFFITDELEPALKRYYYPHRYVVRPQDTPQMQQMALDTICVNLKIIDDSIAQSGPYILGERFSILDIMISYWMSGLKDQSAAAAFSAINHCAELVRARPKLTQRFNDLDALWTAYFNE